MAPNADYVGIDEVHVWYVFTDQVTEPRLLERYAAMLTADERTRRDRYMFAKDRHQFVVTRGVLRTLLARYLAMDPAGCTFSTGPYGRPALVHAQGADPLDFNVSHAEGLIAVALARVPEVGVDVENIERSSISDDLPRRFFSPSEADALDAMPAAARTSRFFDYWTLKEAYIKARGMGLSLPLDGFSMQLETGGPPRVVFAPSIDDDPESWQFAQFDPSPRHRLAVAVRRRGADLTIRCRELAVSAL